MTATKQTSKTEWRRNRMLSMAKLAAEEPGRADPEVFVALPDEKRSVTALEKMGLVKVRRTNKKFAGHTEWYYRLA